MRRPEERREGLLGEEDRKREAGGAAHKHPTVWQLIHGRDHRYIPRAPYAARDGPSELIFNYVEQQLTLKMHEVASPEQLENAVRGIIAGIATFDPYFGSMGYAP